MQTLQLVIRIDRFEGFDESRGPRGRIAMRDALHAPTMIRFDGNDETVVADSYEFILNRLSRPAHQSFKRTRDARAQHIDLVTNGGQLRTRAIVEFAVRLNLVSDTRHHGVQFAWQI